MNLYFNMISLRNVNTNIDLVLFRNFMLRIAEKIAKEKNYLGIITGDSIGQVASQTLENLKSSSYNINIPIYRPLISFDKEEIIKIAKKIGTYEYSIMNYKDCCSLVSKKPKTKVSISQISIYLNKDFESVINKTLNDIKIFKINTKFLKV